jgi:hypothetical protein
MERNRTLGLIVGGIAALSLIAIVIASLGDDTVSLDPDSPEGVVQAYVTAVADGDWAVAHSFFSGDLAERCTVSELSFERMDDVARVSIDDVSMTGQTAVVDVVVTHATVGDPLSTSTWDEDVTFVLIDDEGGWVFDEISWPYFPCRWDEP